MPSAPRQLNVFNVTSRSAIIAWTPPALLNGIRFYTIRVNGIPRSFVSINDTQYEVSGLSPQTRYSLNVYGAYNLFGTDSSPSDTVHIFTPTEGELQPLGE